MSNNSIAHKIILLGASLLLALWLGVALVTNQIETLIYVAAAAVFIVSLLLGRRIWLLFIFFTSMNVVVYRWIGTVDFGQALFISFSLVQFLLRKIPYKAKIGELEIWAFLIIMCVLQAYARNPVGMAFLGSGNVGGRPYMVIAMWFVSSAILSCLIVPAGELKWALKLSILGGFLGIPLQMARYGNLSSMSDATELEIGSGGRIASFVPLSAVISRWVSCKISPLRACFHPFWLCVMVASLAIAAASGYRNAIANIGLIYLVAICYHGGIKAFLGSILLGSLGLMLLALVNLNFPLPGNLQRALSPLPGTWEDQYVESGTSQNEWRIEMWIDALTTDKWIKNKILGDGIGISSELLARMQNMESGLSSKESSDQLSNQQEQFMILGAYHSGPVHSIRMVGYVGLAILLLAMYRVAIYAHRQIQRCKGTEWAPVSLFFGIPLITQPIFFVFIIGQYHVAIATTFMGIAILRLMERNIPLPAYSRKVIDSRPSYRSSIQAGPVASV